MGGVLEMQGMDETRESEGAKMAEVTNDEIRVGQDMWGDDNLELEEAVKDVEAVFSKAMFVIDEVNWHAPYDKKTPEINEAKSAIVRVFDDYERVRRSQLVRQREYDLMYNRWLTEVISEQRDMFRDMRDSLEKIASVA